jgi:hypothetical protein
MPIDVLQVPVYEITCPTCKQKSLHSILDVVTKDRLSCGSCRDFISVADHYRRPDIEELLKSFGYSGDFFGVNDKL